MIASDIKRAEKSDKIKGLESIRQFASVCTL